MSDDGNYLYRLHREPGSPALDLGHDVRANFNGRHGHPDDVRVGLTISHPTPDGQECAGGVTFDVPEAEGLKGPRWTVEQWEPLTISPSIRCSCGHHGFIRESRWVPA